MVTDGAEDGIDGDGPCTAEVRRAEDRHIGNDTGIFDQIADANEVAMNDRLCLYCRPFCIGRSNHLGFGWNGKNAPRDQCSKD